MKDLSMSITSAIKLMQSSTSVEDWNKKRDVCKESLSPKDWETVYKIIDQNGMIVQTIAKNKTI